ncbi:hypothetical protein NADFUDRAFT_71447 [Nadsonia fulvescens var. elongata DSM 6958]|uniref:Uncharacterized protein n=1 Tax=Nadsonia fulvescens var. elongata DSM 6958 TaxID=857566 RepID=A0A1E3PGU9_9ASCO|nr:hypothetical protein NADFUDRAFT_71447 [Nadsonia fulvescens var. elongata DSM 6958]
MCCTIDVPLTGKFKNWLTLFSVYTVVSQVKSSPKLASAIRILQIRITTLASYLLAEL